MSSALAVCRPFAFCAACTARKDPHAALGVRRGASLAEVKRRYRELAKLHHPDRNPADREGAEQRFKAVSHAYVQLLGCRVSGVDVDDDAPSYSPFTASATLRPESSFSVNSSETMRARSPTCGDPTVTADRHSRTTRILHTRPLWQALREERRLENEQALEKLLSSRPGVLEDTTRAPCRRRHMNREERE